MVDEYGALPVHPTTGLTAVGLLRDGRPVWPVIGAAPDDGDAGGDDAPDGDDQDADDTGDDADSGDGDDTTGAGPADGWTPPTQDQWRALDEKRRRANREAARRRTELDQVRAELAQLKASQQQGNGPADGAAAAQAAADLAQAQQRLEAVTTREQAAMKAAARTAIRAAGYSGASDGRMMTSLLGMVRFTDLEVDDDGEIVGLDEQISDIKGELPDLFKSADPEPARPTRRRVPSADAGSRQPPPAPAKSWADRLQEQLTGGAGRQ